MLQIECLCLPKNSYVEIPAPKVMTLGGGALGGHEVMGVLMNGISALIKLAQEGFLVPFCLVR